MCATRDARRCSVSTACQHEDVMLMESRDTEVRKCTVCCLETVPKIKTKYARLECYAGQRPHDTLGEES